MDTDGAMALVFKRVVTMRETKGLLDGELRGQTGSIVLAAEVEHELRDRIIAEAEGIGLERANRYGRERGRQE